MRALPVSGTAVRPVLLLIMDGIGIGNQSAFDAVYQANTPVLDRLYKTQLFRTLKAHGTAVGMPSDADIGNSEVGHNTLGAGRVIPQGATVVNQAIKTGNLGDTWTALCQHLQRSGGTLHLIGLLSDGNVHAHTDHLYALIRAAATAGITRCRVHILLDGRDVAPRSALKYSNELEAVLAQTKKDYKIASGGGRMVMTLDRYEADWPMVERGWRTHVLGEGMQVACAKDAIKTAYATGIITDQDIPPFVVAQDQQPIGRIQDGDAVVMTHFRGDRAIELSQAFEDPAFKAFDRVRWPQVFYAGMMQYDGDINCPQKWLVDPVHVPDPVGSYWCATGLHSFALSETQKYGHVTYFWNGNKSGYINNKLETYHNIPSKTLPFDQQPDMQADAITQAALDYSLSGQYQHGRVNFPNGDMVGHTGNLAATIQAVETVDRCVGILTDAMTRIGGITVILADHGNADDMGYQDEHGIHVKTAHTRNPVPCCIVNAPAFTWRNNTPEDAGLSTIASTLTTLMGYHPPEHYDPSLVTAL